MVIEPSSNEVIHFIIIILVLQVKEKMIIMFEKKIIKRVFILLDSVKVISYKDFVNFVVEKVVFNYDCNFDMCKDYFCNETDLVIYL